MDARTWFLFEKKNQETFGLAGCCDGVANARRAKVFLVLFFPKENSFLTEASV
jgi:hypothetical protein